MPESRSLPDRDSITPDLEAHRMALPERSSDKPLWTQAREEAERAIDLLAYGEARCNDAARHMNEAARLASAIYPAACERAARNA